MHRVAIIAAATAVVSVSVPAEAVTIIQGASEFIGLPVRGFDTSLGTLVAVYLHVDVYKTRGWRLDTPLGSINSRAVTWSVNGMWNGPFGARVQLTGAGNSTVDMLPSATLGRDYGYFTVAAGGSGDFSLDPAQFINRSFIQLDGMDPGYFDVTGADTRFGLDADARVSRGSGQCRGPDRAFSEDDCGSVVYRLIYDYDPLVAPVPEPATWAMMLLGFGGMGYAMRRRDRGSVSLRLG